MKNMDRIKKPKLLKASREIIAEDIVSTALFRYDIEDWSSILVELFGTFLIFEIPTRRYSNIQITTNDGKLTTDYAKLRIEQILLPISTPLGPVSYQVSHKSALGNPKNIKTTFTNKANDGNIFILGPDKHLKITAEVVEEPYSAGGKYNHKYGFNFSRQHTTQYNDWGMPFEECEFMQIEYNKGTLELLATDEYEAQELFDKFVGFLKTMTNGILENWDEHYQFILGRGELSLHGRYSLKYTELLMEIVAVGHPDIVQSETIKGDKSTVRKFVGTNSRITEVVKWALAEILEMV